RRARGGARTSLEGGGRGVERIGWHPGRRSPRGERAGGGGRREGASGGDEDEAPPRGRGKEIARGRVETGGISGGAHNRPPAGRRFRGHHLDRCPPALGGVARGGRGPPRRRGRAGRAGGVRGADPLRGVPPPTRTQ